jgi:hypothetical protein
MSNHVCCVAGQNDLQLGPLAGGPTQVADQRMLELRVQVRLWLLDDHRRVEGRRREERVLLAVALGACLPKPLARIGELVRSVAGFQIPGRPSVGRLVPRRGPGRVDGLHCRVRYRGEGDRDVQEVDVAEA